MSYDTIQKRDPDDMSDTRNFIPFNKDGASIRQAKDALNAMELLFDLVKRGEPNDVIGAHVKQLRWNWESKYVGEGMS